MAGSFPDLEKRLIPSAISGSRFGLILSLVATMLIDRSQKPIQIGKAKKETTHLAHMEACRVAKNRKVVNMNYPQADMPLEEIQRFWGEISSEEDRSKS